MSTEDVHVTGVAQPVTPNAEIGVRGVSDATITLDGKEVEPRKAPGGLRITAIGLGEGQHELTVETPRTPSWLGSDSTTRKFTVDSTPPRLQVADSLRPESPNQPVDVSGSAEGAESVRVAGEEVETGRDGAFRVRVDRPEREVRVVATDAAGNRAEKVMTVHTKHPGMRAVHMTGLAWTSDALREPVLEMARQGKIDTVELDLKDESGEVVYDSQVPMANRIGAVKNYYDAREALDQLHSMGVRVVGRLVAFKDPILGKASWESGHPERVIQDASGQPWQGGYGSYAFTNFADPVVRQYNVDIATEAARLGFDDILYDYVRRPDGHIEQMRIPNLRGTPEQGIAGFLKETQAAVRSSGALLGASVFGIAVDRPTEIAQDIPQMAKYVDYIAPMVYPSHWAQGEFGVPDPNSQPFDIVQRSLAAFGQQVEGTDVQIIPWLQDFSLGVGYGAAEVRAQIDAAASNGMNSFLLWAPNCRYHEAALVPGAG
ncbi:putative glycoside hydrolase [Saccharopolyspora griseoalba]|uniref:Glycoside hydrolase n=1 Tax=Saccharopolyspora griseoalba TaxID=1431848 RepID=A0ABW2LRC4_9PSEU